MLVKAGVTEGDGVGVFVGDMVAVWVIVVVGEVVGDGVYPGTVHDTHISRTIAEVKTLNFVKGFFLREPNFIKNSLQLFSSSLLTNNH